jgi:hypothetical protein
MSHIKHACMICVTHARMSHVTHICMSRVTHAGATTMQHSKAEQKQEEIYASIHVIDECICVKQGSQPTPLCVANVAVAMCEWVVSYI